MDFPNAPFGLNAFGRLAFGVTSELYTTSTWLAAYKGEDDTQNIGIDGDICNLMPKGTISATSNHNTPVYAKTADRGYQVYDANTPVWTGGRYTRNNARWSEDLTNAVYELAGLGLGSVPLTTLIAAGGPNGEEATRIQLDLNGGTTTADQSRILQVVGTVENSSTSMSIWVKSNDNNDYTVRYDFSGQSPSGDSSTFLVGQEWVKVERTFDSASDSANSAALRLRGAQNTSDTADILVTGWQQNNLSSIGEYVKTTDAARTVTYSTDANGIALDPHPFLQTNRPATNSMRYSNEYSSWIIGANTGVTPGQLGIDGGGSASMIEDTSAASLGYIFRNVSVPDANATHTCRFFVKKDVSATGWSLLSVDPKGATDTSFSFHLNRATGASLEWANTANGQFRVKEVGDFWEVYVSVAVAASDITQIRSIFYPVSSSNGVDLDLTLIGSAILGNVETHLNKTIEQVLDQPPIFTTTAAESITETDYTYPADNIDPSNATVSFQMDWAGDNVDVLDIGGGLTLSALSPNLILSDGTNSISVAITEGTRGITLTLTAATMRLNVDGVAVSGPYNPPAAGVITCKETMWALWSKPYA